MKPIKVAINAKIVEHVYVNGKHYINSVDQKTGKPTTVLVGKRG